jgi:hypothetical protein
MADVLGRAGFDLARERGAKTDFRLAGRVAIDPPRGGKQLIRIVWILSGPAGREIGRISQANQVPAGSLDHAWGGTAYEVALAAVGGIIALIQRPQAPAGS